MLVKFCEKVEPLSKEPFRKSVIELNVARPVVLGKRRVRADIILAEIRADFEDMLAMSNGEVVNQLVLPDLAALRIGTVAPAHAPKRRSVRKAPCGWERLD